MHRDEVPLLEMIDALGLTRHLDADGLRDVIVGLDASEVATIRDAFVAEATQAAAPAIAASLTEPPGNLDRADAVSIGWYA